MNYPVNCNKCTEPLYGPVKYCPFCGYEQAQIVEPDTSVISQEPERVREEHPKEDPIRILEQDFIDATKVDKKLYPSTANFLYEKGSSLGLYRDIITKLIDEWVIRHNVVAIPHDDETVAVDTPKLEINQTNFDFSNLKTGSSTQGSFTISNTGGGTLSGSIKSNKNWLKVNQESIDTSQHKQEISFSIDTTGLPLGFKDTGTIDIQSTGGIKRISVNLFLEVLERDIGRFRKALTIGCLIFGGLLGFIFSWGADITTFIGIVALVCTIYGMLGYILAPAIRKAMWRGDKKIPVAAGIGAVALSALIIIIVAKGSIPFYKTASSVLTVTSNSAKIRKSPSKSAGFIAQVNRGFNLGVLDTQGDWYEVQYFSQRKNKIEIGWIHKSLVAKIDSHVPGETNTKAKPSHTTRKPKRKQLQKEERLNVSPVEPPIAVKESKIESATPQPVPTRRSNINQGISKPKERFDEDIPRIPQQ